MHQIKDTELTPSERYFIDNSLSLIEKTFDAFVDNHVDVENIDHYFASAEKPIIDAMELVAEANQKGDLIDAQGWSIDADFKLTTAEIEYKNFVIEIKRATEVVGSMQIVLDATTRFTQGRLGEYSARIDELKERIEKATEKLNWCMTEIKKDEK